ncbi:MAG: SRPBCC family protein, partial [Myxococcota bacterium]
MLSNLRTLLIGIAISLAIAITAALFLPSTWRVEVSSVIQASPEEVHPFVSDFQQWGRWAQWSEAEDPNVQLESGMENDTPVQRVRGRGEDRAVLVMDHRDAQGVQVSAKGRVQGVQT